MNKQEFQQKIKDMKPPKFFTAISLGEAYEAGFEEAKGNALYNSCFLNEPEKPVVPQYVADWIESQKESFSDASAIDMYDNLTLDNKGGYYHEVWLWVIDHHYDFIKAWHDGYEIEKEKLYTAMLKISGEYLRLDCEGNFGHFKVDLKYFLDGTRAYQFTEDDLVKYHIWGNDNYEVKEVEE